MSSPAQLFADRKHVTIRTDQRSWAGTATASSIVFEELACSGPWTRRDPDEGSEAVARAPRALKRHIKSMGYHPEEPARYTGTMAIPNQSQQTRPYLTLFLEGFWHFYSFLIAVAFDSPIAMVVFCFLLLFGLLLNVGKAYGISEDHISAFDAAHFWLNYAVFLIIGISFIWRLLCKLFR